MKLHCLNSTPTKIPSNRLFQSISSLIEDEIGKIPGQINLIFCDDETIRKLNKTYRQKDEITDVLSFPYVTKNEERLPAGASGEEEEGKTKKGEYEKESSAGEGDSPFMRPSKLTSNGRARSRKGPGVEEPADDLIGEIYICVSQTERQAQKAEWTEKALKCFSAMFLELYKLCIHGLLHLRGYDHIIDSDYRVMKLLEEKIMKSFLESNIS